MICKKCGSNNKEETRFCLYCGSPFNAQNNNQNNRSKLPIQFAYVCNKKFDELKGDSKHLRNCDVCQLDVVNLDVLSEIEKIEVFEKASKTSSRLCISATTTVQNIPDCPKGSTRPSMPPPRPTAGMPVMPPKEILAKARADNDGSCLDAPKIRIVESEAEEKKSFLDKLKGLFGL